MLCSLFFIYLFFFAQFLSLSRYILLCLFIFALFFRHLLYLLLHTHISGPLVSSVLLFSSDFVPSLSHVLLSSAIWLWGCDWVWAERRDRGREGQMEGKTEGRVSIKLSICDSASANSPGFSSPPLHLPLFSHSHSHSLCPLALHPASQPATLSTEPWDWLFFRGGVVCEGM